MKFIQFIGITLFMTFIVCGVAFINLDIKDEDKSTGLFLIQFFGGITMMGFGAYGIFTIVVDEIIDKIKQLKDEK